MYFLAKGVFSKYGTNFFSEFLFIYLFFMFCQISLILILIIFKILKNYFVINLEFSMLLLQLSRKKKQKFNVKDKRPLLSKYIFTIL